jgi:hypothetical protein
VAHANFAEASFNRSVAFTGWRNVRATINVGALAIGAAGSVAFAGENLPSETVWTRLRRATIRCAEKALAHIKGKWQSVKTHVGKQFVRLRLHHRYRKSSPTDEIFPVFGGEVEFTGINFVAPSLVSFSDVDFSRAYLRGTNVRGARFLNVNWWQPRLGRNGLYDELFLADSTDGAFRWRYLPVLEETYRNVRVALEESKSHAAAADFYVGEMNAYRARMGFWERHIFSVPAWYNILTRYGTSIGRGVMILVLLLLAHVIATAIWQEFDLHDLLSRSTELLLRSVRLATLQQDEVILKVSGLGQRWIDTTFRITAAAQIALVVLAFRTRIRRY